METVVVIWFTLMTVAAIGNGYFAYQWRKTALSYQAFINDPNVKVRDKEAEYKDSFEAQLNALDEERRRINVAVTEVFDFLNDNGPFGSHDEQLKQCRNVLLTALQTSTYRGEL